MKPEEMKVTPKITPRDVLKGKSPCVLTATLEPVADLDRFQPAGFPEVGRHCIYRAPRENGTVENVCIVDSAASMANHLESVCMRGPHDFDLVDDLEGMPYLRCITGSIGEDRRLGDDRELVVTSLTEGHPDRLDLLPGWPKQAKRKMGRQRWSARDRRAPQCRQLWRRIHAQTLAWF